jgi:hypothetical protein
MSSTLTSAPLGTDSLPGRRPFIKQSNGFRRTRKCGDEYVWQSHTTCLNLTPAILSRWLGGLGTAAPTQLEKRTRRHLRAARVVRRANLIKPVPRQQWIDRAHDFFADHDVLITPMFATLPPAARRWSARGWTPNALTAIDSRRFWAPGILPGFPPCPFPPRITPAGYRSVSNSSRRREANRGSWPWQHSWNHLTRGRALRRNRRAANTLSLELEQDCYSADFEFSADQVGGYGLPRLPEDPWELAGLVQEFAIGLGEATPARHGCVDDPVESF